jgi:hypothetical protein
MLIEREVGYESPSKPSAGAIHEAAVLFGGNLRIKNRQDIAPTDGFDRLRLY